MEILFLERELKGGKNHSRVRLAEHGGGPHKALMNQSEHGTTRGAIRMIASSSVPSEEFDTFPIIHADDLCSAVCL